jgi:hypothetical protein
MVLLFAATGNKAPYTVPIILKSKLTDKLQMRDGSDPSPEQKLKINLESTQRC